MSTATGLGLLDTALLLAVDDACGESLQGVKSKTILRRLHAETGEDPLDGYGAMVSLVQPWRASVPLLEGRGNFGSPGNDPPAEMRYTECRLTTAGRAAVAAERGSGPPIPFGLILGSMFRGGERPPFHPRRVADAIELVARGGHAWDGVLALGLPSFPGGATLTLDLQDQEMHHLRKGWSARLEFESVIREVPSGRPGHARELEIVALPPYSNWDAIVSAIAERANQNRQESPLRSIQDLGDCEIGLRIVCTPRAGIPIEVLHDFLRDVPGIDVTMEARLSTPAADLLTEWVDHHGPQAAIAGAEALRALEVEEEQ